MSSVSQVDEGLGGRKGLYGSSADEVPKPLPNEGIMVSGEGFTVELSLKKGDMG